MSATNNGATRQAEDSSLTATDSLEPGKEDSMVVADSYNIVDGDTDAGPNTVARVDN